MKTFKVYLEIPENWIDVESPILWASRSIADTAKQMVLDALIDQYLTKVTLPEITWTRDEVKAKIIDKLAERALDKQE